MMDNVGFPEEDDETFDIYDALGLNTPVGDAHEAQVAYDPLAAFMDDDDEDESLLTAPTPGFQTSSESVESLLATLARDLLDHEILQSTLSGGHPVMSSLKVERDRDAYHLSLIIDMGGHQIKPFATVLAVENRWKPLSPPKGLHARWKPVYDSLCKALTGALAQQGRPSSI